MYINKIMIGLVGTEILSSENNVERADFATNIFLPVDYHYRHLHMVGRFIRLVSSYLSQ